MQKKCHNLENLIPQRPPIVMVDQLIEKTVKITVSSFRILPDNIFVENDHLKEPGIVENIAQTAALGTGYEACINDTEPELGFIGAIKSLEIHKHPEVGDTLITKVNVEHQVFNATIIEGRVFVAGDLIASCQMKIFLMGDNN